MALTDTENNRILAIEQRLNELQTASNNLATKRELKALLAVLNRQLQDLQEAISQLELTGSGGALASHKINPDAHTQLNERYYQKSEFISTSDGVSDAGEPVKLNVLGLIDETMLGLDDIDLIQSGISNVHARSHEMDSVADHSAAASANWGKYVRANPTDGAIEFVELDITADHGELTGLADDDHSQYHNDARAATWLSATTSGLLDHTKLADLSADDHVQYVLTDGTRPITGPFSVLGHLTASGVNINTTLGDIETALDTILGE